MRCKSGIVVKLQQGLLVSFLINLLALVLLLLQTPPLSMTRCEPADWNPTLALAALRTARFGDELRDYAMNARLSHVVILVGSHQISNLQRVFDSWTQHLPVINRASNASHLAGPLGWNISLILYYIPSRPIDLGKVETLHKMFNDLPAPVRAPFSSFQVHSFLMHTRNYVAYYGREMLFDRLVQGHLGLRNVQYVYYMNTSSRPVRSNWLYNLDASVRWPSPLMVMRTSLVQPAPQMPFHFDDDGIYFLGDPTLRRIYTNQIKETREYGQTTGSCGQKIYNYLTSLESSEQISGVRHLFQPTQLLLSTSTNETSVESLARSYPWLQMHRVHTQ